MTCQIEKIRESDEIVIAPTSLGGGLASNLGEGVLSQAGIEDGIGDLVAIVRGEC
jgi:hypothetical protein